MRHSGSGLSAGSMTIPRRQADKGRVMLGLLSVIVSMSLLVENALSAEPLGRDLERPVRPIEDSDYRSLDMDQVRLGQLLFYDKVLSGNQNISCGTCHHHDHASADGVSLPVGEGGVGVGPERTVGEGDDRIHRRVPRHTPALFNLGATGFDVLFHDGRVTPDPAHPSGFNTPAADDLPSGLADVVAAQAMFPVTSHTEMAGGRGENEVGSAAQGEIDHVWPLLAKRLQRIPEYEPLFRAAFDDIEQASDITYVHAANALSAFQQFEWRADRAPFDLFLRGDVNALSKAALRGMDLFYGGARCASCHAGPFQTDHDFHAIAVPQFGPGRTRRFDSVARDRGRLNETDRIEDAYKFRTPSLRNVAATAPYGHTGAFATLEAMIRHHTDPVASNIAWRRDQAQLADHDTLAKVDFLIMTDVRDREALLKASELSPFKLSEAEISDLIAFLESLTDEASVAGRLGRPDRVPSGLAVD